MSVAKKSAIQLCSGFCAVATLVLLSAVSADAAPVSYLIGVDTSSLPTPFQGFLDFQFNPGITPFQTAIATVSNFNTDGVVPATPLPQVSGSISGTLLTTLSLRNDGTVPPDFLQSFTFGKFLSFMLELTGPALNTPDGSAASGTTFSLSLLDSTQRPILTTPPGPVVTVNVNLDTTTTVSSFLTGPPVVTVDQVPEPGSMMLLTFGTAGLLFLRKILR